MFGVRVVNDQQVSTFTRHRAADADSKVLTILISSPSPRALRVLPQRHVRKNLGVLLRPHKVSNLPAKVHRQISSVRRLNHFLVRVLAKEPARQKKRSKLTLRMSRAKVDDQSLQLTFRNLLKLLGHHRMVPPMNKPRPHLLHIRHEALLALLPLQSILVVLHLLQQLLLIRRTQTRH